MSELCDEFDRALASGEIAGEEESPWREHVAGCAVCRQQANADALLREALATAPPELAAGFEGRLRLRIEQRAGEGSASARRPGSLRPSGLWALAAYGTAAAIASVVIVSRLPWESFTPSPALGFTLATILLLSPLVLLDRLGIVRPPG